VVSCVLAASGAQAITYIRANGQTSATVIQDQSAVLTLDCTPGGTVVAAPVLDVNGNGVYDPAVDRVQDNGWLYVDGSIKDEDARSGYYQETMMVDVGPDAGLTYLLVATEVGSASTATCSVTFVIPTTSTIIQGHVSTSDGPPAVGVSVYAAGANDRDLDDEPWGPNVRSDLANENGDYVIYVPSGGNYIVGEADMEDWQTGCRRQVYVATGATLSNINFQLPAALSACGQSTQYKISGYVKDGLNRPLPFVGIRTSGENDPSAYTNLSGYYEIMVSSGSHEFYLSLGGYVQNQSYAMNVTGNATLNMAMHRAAYRVQGVVRNASNSLPIPWAQVELSLASGYWDYDDCNQQGQYLMWTDAAAVYLQASSDRGYYDRNYAQVSISSNTTQDIALSPRTATITGRVTDNRLQNVAWAEVEAQNNTNPYGMKPKTYTNPDGTYTLKITPGDTYDVTYAKLGWQDSTYYNLVLSSGQTQQINQQLIYVSDAPVLSGGKVTPATGDTNTTFTYEVTYTDQNNGPPSLIKVTIDVNEYAMTAASAGDTVYTDGKKYVYSTKLSGGPHKFAFYAEDSNEITNWLATCERQVWRGPCVAAGPVNLSVSPATGAFTVGVKYTFTGRYSDADGYADLANCYLLLHTTVANQTNAAFLRYDANTNLLYVKNDANTAWLGGFAPGSAYTIENSYVRLYCAQSTKSGSVNQLNVNWWVSFKTAMSGRTCGAWMLVFDDASHRDGYDQMGSNIKIGQPPANVSVAPSTGPVAAGPKVTFTGRYSDPDGYANLANCYLLINNTLNGVNAAFLRYDQNTNLLYVKNDANTSWGVGAAPGSATVLQNSYVSLYCAETTVSGSGNQLTVNWKVILKPTMSGRTCGAWLLVYDDLGLRDGYDQMGSNIRISQLPVNVSLSPSGGALPIGAWFTLTGTYSDPDGNGNLANCYLLLDTSLDPVNGVFVRYDANANKLYLKDDANTAWTGGYAPGAASAIHNTQCALSCSGTTVTPSGNTLVIGWRLYLKAPMAHKTLPAWMLLYDDAGLRDGYDQKGSFTTP
jgi:hypothetical protein